jgi:hypothetical protein
MDSRLWGENTDEVNGSCLSLTVLACDVYLSGFVPGFVPVFVPVFVPEFVSVCCVLCAER